MKILITGMSGALAGLLAERLAEEGHELVGADVRPLPAGRTFKGEFHLVRRYIQRRMADVFRTHKPEALVHMGRIRGTALTSFNTRYTQNVLGTRHLLELSRRYEVGRVVVLSTFHVYGAHQHNHILIKEDHPLRASQIFPELADAVELDHAATSFLWRYREVSTAVLRPVNIVGPTVNNMISRLMRLKRCPRLLGYDPAMQFVHEADVAQALVRALSSRQEGVFNLAGEGVVPYSRAIKLAGSRPIAVPHVLAYPMLHRLERYRFNFPMHMLDYFRYPTVIDDDLIRETFDYRPEYTTLETLQSVPSGRATPSGGGR